MPHPQPTLWFIREVEAADRVYAETAASHLSGMVALLVTDKQERVVEKRNVWRRIRNASLAASFLFAATMGIFNYGVLVGNENLQEAKMLVKETGIYIWQKNYNRVTGEAG